MPRIPAYEQGQLASSLVGTAGADTSTASAFETAASGLGQVAQQAVYYQAAQQREQYRLQKEAAAAAKAQQKVLDDIQVATELAKMTPEILAQQEDIRKSRTPDQWGAAFSENLNPMLEKINSGGYTPEVTQGLQKQIAQKWDSGVTELTKEGLTQQTNNAKVEMSNAYDALTAHSAAAESVGDIGKLWVQGRELQAKASLVFGDAKAAEMQTKFEQETSKQFLYGQVVKSPEAVEQTLKSGAFGERLSNEEKEKFIFQAHSLLRAKESQMKQDVRAEGDLSEIKSISESVSIPDNDVAGQTAYANKKQQELDAELSKPSAQQNVSKVKFLRSEIDRANGNIKSSETDAKQDAAEARAAEERRRKEIHDAPKSLNARVAVDKEYTDLMAEVKNKKFSTRDTAVVGINKFKKLAATTRQNLANHVMTQAEAESMLRKINEQITKGEATANKPKNLLEQVLSGFNDPKAQADAKRVVDRHETATKLNKTPEGVQKWKQLHDDYYSQAMQRLAKVRGGAENVTEADKARFEKLARQYATSNTGRK